MYQWTLKLENFTKMLNFLPRKKCLTDLEIARETELNDYIEIVFRHFFLNYEEKELLKYTNFV